GEAHREVARRGRFERVEERLEVGGVDVSVRAVAALLGLRFATGGHWAGLLGHEGRRAIFILRWRGRKSCAFQGFREVTPEVVHVLEADREPDEVLRDAIAFPARPRLDQRLDST